MNKNAKIVPLILAGGRIDHLWPQGTHDLPKPFLPLKVGGTTFQNTIARIQNKNIFAAPIALCSKQYAPFVEKLLSQENPRLVYEPDGRHTATASCLGALAVKEYVGQSELMLILPVDHYIEDIALFDETVARAVPYANEGSIVTFGVTAEFGHTKYGYIEQGRPVTQDIYVVKSFTEKPRIRAAHSFYNSGRHYWNTGIYLVRTDVLLAEMKTYQADIFETIQAVWGASSVQGRCHYLNQDSFAKLPFLSFENAIMEQTERSHVVYARFKWQDLGGWDALMEFAVEADSHHATYA